MKAGKDQLSHIPRQPLIPTELLLSRALVRLVVGVNIYYIYLITRKGYQLKFGSLVKSVNQIYESSVAP